MPFTRWKMDTINHLFIHSHTPPPGLLYGEHGIIWWTLKSDRPAFDS